MIKRTESQHIAKLLRIHDTIQDEYIQNYIIHIVSFLYSLEQNILCVFIVVSHAANRISPDLYPCLLGCIPYKSSSVRYRQRNHSPICFLVPRPFSSFNVFGSSAIMFYCVQLESKIR